MKKIIQSIGLLMAFLAANCGLAQDSLQLSNLRPFAHSFSIVNGKLQGKGAAILTKAIAQSHITMLGDNQRSKLESTFTGALLQELHRNQYRNMVLETGFGSNATLSKLAQQPKQFTQALKQLNQQYACGPSDNQLVPIPDFKTVEAAQFAQRAVENDWSLMAIGTDSWTGFQLLLDGLYNNISPSNQTVYDSLYQASSTLLKKAYDQVTEPDNDNVKVFIETLKASTALANFLDAMGQFTQNEALLDALAFAFDYWALYGQRDFYTKNKQQAKRNKGLLAKQLNEKSFDFQKDKLFIKMWVNHLAKGTTVSGFYGVGNMLQEMAAYHGHATVNIAMARRFYKENGVIKDILVSGNPYLNFKELLPLGQQATWTLIDLRPFNEVFFWKGYPMSLAMHKILARYDFLVIPPTDEVGTSNW